MEEKIPVRKVGDEVRVMATDVTIKEGLANRRGVVKDTVGPALYGGEWYVVEFEDGSKRVVEGCDLGT